MMNWPTPEQIGGVVAGGAVVLTICGAAAVKLFGKVNRIGENLGVDNTKVPDVGATVNLIARDVSIIRESQNTFGEKLAEHGQLLGGLRKDHDELSGKHEALHERVERVENLGPPGGIEERRESKNGKNGIRRKKAS